MFRLANLDQASDIHVWMIKIKYLDQLALIGLVNCIDCKMLTGTSNLRTD